MTKTIHLAGGCFWGVDAYFSRIPGVVATASGYANSTAEAPSYEQVCSGRTGAAEAVRVEYDPERVSLSTLIAQFFRIIDPMDAGGQGGDRGSQYRTGIYWTDAADLPEIEDAVAREQRKYAEPVATEVRRLENFFEAEDCHQDYLEKNPGGYCHVDFRNLATLALDGLEAASIDPAKYSRPTDAELREKLSIAEWHITQEEGTEAPFTGEYWDHRERGIYVDKVTGEPLFSSADKFDSGCGWPSFTRPMDWETIVERDDRSIPGRRRTEIRSRVGATHLGHVFVDGPVEAGGLRYCIDSASIDFVPYEDMDERGYGDLKGMC